MPPHAPDPSKDALRAVLIDAAQQHGQQWFPELSTRAVRASVTTTARRPGGSLYRLMLDAGSHRRLVLAKSRRPSRVSHRSGADAGRPSLVPDVPLSAAEGAQREYDGLRALAETLGGNGDSDHFGVVRPLLLLPEHATLVMEYVEQPTLRQSLLHSTRLHALRTGPAVDEQPWHNAGAWLRAYHRTSERYDLRTRLSTRDEVVELLPRFAHFLSRQLPREPLLAEMAPVAAALSSELPSTFPLAVAHGDFAPRNLFLDDKGRVSGFDPMPRWLAPVYDDLARFLVGVRLVGPQLASQGAAFSGAQLDRYQAAVLAGYFGDDPVPERELAAFQLLVLLDTWAGMVSIRRSAPWRRRVRRRALRTWTSPQFRREGRRLLARLDRGRR